MNGLALRQLFGRLVVCLLCGSGAVFASIIPVATASALDPNDHATMPGLNQYHAGGISFTSDLGVGVVMANPDGGSLHLATANSFGYPVGEELYDTAQRGNPITWTFSQNISAMGVWAFSATGANYYDLDLYDRSGNYLQTLTFIPSLWSQAMYIGFTDTDGPEIAKAVLTDSPGPAQNYFYIGSLDLADGAPEPGTWLLAGSGLLAAVWAGLPAREVKIRRRKLS